MWQNGENCVHAFFNDISVKVSQVIPTVIRILFTDNISIVTNCHAPAFTDDLVVVYELVSNIIAIIVNSILTVCTTLITLCRISLSL